MLTRAVRLRYVVALLAFGGAAGCSLLLRETTFRDDDGGRPVDGGRDADVADAARDAGPDAMLDAAVDFDAGPPGPCNPSPCANAGRCTVIGDGFECVCDGTGHEGLMCETPIVCMGALAPANGSVSSATAPFGESVTYGCDAGYSLEGSASARCQADGSFSSPPPSCAPNPCPALGHPIEGSVSAEGGVVGDVVTYSCNPGFVRIGPAARACEASGRWSGIAPACVLCTTDRWCWENPRPQGNDLQGLWARAPDDVWAVGASGVVLRWNGSFWSVVPSGTAEWLYGVWARAANDVTIAGGGGTILRWNGSVMRSEASGTSRTLFSAHGGSSSSAVAVGAGGTVLRRSGSPGSWTTESSGTSRDLWAAWDFDGIAWAAGDEGTLLRRSGGPWAPVPSGVTGRLQGLWASASDDLWAVGWSSTVLRWNGSEVSALSGAASSASAVWGSTSDDVWVVGGGAIQRWHAGMWESFSVPGLGALSAVGGAAPDDVWAVGPRGAMARWDGTDWTRTSARHPVDTFEAVTGTSAADVWAVGGVNILHRDETAWRLVPSGATQGLWGVWARTPTDAWAVGEQGTVLRWDGSAWTPSPVALAAHLVDVWGSAADDVWVVGASGTILHWDGTRWTLESSGTSVFLRAIWGFSANDVWAVGDGGTILHWDGTAWRAVTSGVTQNLRAIWGASSTDAWAVGNAGTTLRWDGVSWRSIASGLGNVVDVWGTSSTDVWALTANGHAQWNGTAWSAETRGGSFGSLRALWGSGPGEVWVVGWESVILRYRP